jgi:hypothetical protein
MIFESRRRADGVTNRGATRGGRVPRSPGQFVAVVAATLVLAVAGCRGEQSRSESRSVGLEGARSVTATVETRGAELEIAGGSEDLMEGDFSYKSEGFTSYDASEWRPELDYGVQGDRGTLRVGLPDVGVAVGSVRRVANLRFNDGVPLELTADTGGSNLTADFSGRRADLAAEIRPSRGSTTLRLPADVGARVAVDEGHGVIRAGGLRKQGGAYVNGAYGGPGPSLDIRVEGEGDVTLETAG